MVLMPVLLSNCTEDRLIRLEPVAGLQLGIKDHQVDLFKGLDDHRVMEYPDQFEGTVEVYTNERLNRTATVPFVLMEHYFYEAASGLEVPVETPLYLRVMAVINDEYLEGFSEEILIEQGADPYLIYVDLYPPGEFENW